MWLSHTREESPDTRQEVRGAGPVSPRRALQGAAGMPARSGGRARCGRAQTAETGRADQATEGPRRVANIAPADGEWDEEDSTGDRTGTGLVTRTGRA